jgi:hypothetical protein
MIVQVSPLPDPQKRAAMLSYSLQSEKRPHVKEVNAGSDRSMRRQKR